MKVTLAAITLLVTSCLATPATSWCQNLGDQCTTDSDCCADDAFGGFTVSCDQEFHGGPTCVLLQDGHPPPQEGQCTGMASECESDEECCASALGTVTCQFGWIYAQKSFCLLSPKEFPDPSSLPDFMEPIDA